MRRSAACAFLAVAACAPDLPRRPSLIERPAILAVRSEPAEVMPGGAASLTALVVPSAEAPATWAFCAMPLGAAAATPIPAACVGGSAPASRPIAATGAGPIPVLVPADACTLFGSTPPPPPAGQPPRRPADPDATGGYAIPVRVALPSTDVVSFGAVRLACPLVSAPASVARALRERARPNRNPTLLRFGLSGGRDVVASGASVRVLATWEPDAAEPYVRYDPATGGLVDAHERLRVSWYADAGELSRDADDVIPSAIGDDVGWTAPPAPGVAQLWIVLRDDRGGVDWARVELRVATP